MKTIKLLLALALIFQCLVPVCAQEVPARRVEVFPAEIHLPIGEKIEKQKVRLRFEADRLLIEVEPGAPLKSLSFAEIKAADYSYSKHPRWK